jgi:polyphenol oxidase
VKPVVSARLGALPGIRHAFFTREGGVSEGLYASLNGGIGSGDERRHVIENRRRMAAHMGVTAERFTGVWQVHSADCVVTDGPWPGEERPKADALATATPGLAIAIATADCGPILFADPVARVIGAAHAGWKGAFDGVIEATIARMETLGAARARITAAIGPMLSQRNYEVGPEFIDRFMAADAANASFFIASRRAGHAMFDLPAYIARRLAAAGIAAIDDTALCTYADPARFYSYRRATHLKEADYGRLLAAISLAPSP